LAHRRLGRFYFHIARLNSELSFLVHATIGIQDSMRLSHEERILRLKMRISANRRKFDEHQTAGEIAKCRACIRQDRYLQKKLKALENEGSPPPNK
jgi:hypothetical protein